MVPYIRDFDCEVCRKRTLYRQIPRLKVGFFQIQWNVEIFLIYRSVGNNAIRRNSRHQWSRKPPSHRAGRAEGVHSVERVVLFDGKIERVLIVRKRWIDTDPVTGANDGLFADTVGYSKSRRKIVVVRLTPHVGRNLTDSRQFETVRDRVVV